VDLAPGRYVKLQVRDTGIGMDEETLANIFEPFFTTKEEVKGTGLGLAIVYGIVQQHDGAIGAHSAPGEGTTFTIYLPATDGQPTRRGSGTEVMPKAGNEAVLVVEDQQEVLNLLRAMLEGSGYRVQAVSSAEEAVEIVADGEFVPDLLVTDVVMPEMGGVEMASILRERIPDLPVLFMSGYSQERLPDDALFLQKPFDSGHLLALVRQALDEAPRDGDTR
jgi:CheY-like chemotaxis protein